MTYRDYKWLNHCKDRHPEYADKIRLQSCEEKFELYQDVMNFWEYLKKNSDDNVTYSDALDIVKLYQQFEMNNLLIQIMGKLEKLEDNIFKY